MDEATGRGAAAIGVTVAALAVPALQAVEPTVIIGPIANVATEGSNVATEGSLHNGATEGSIATPGGPGGAG